MQLLTNANKYTPNGGTIALKIECDNGYIQASVCDTGPGIPLSEQEKIFNPYYRGAKADAQRASQSSGWACPLQSTWWNFMAGAFGWRVR